MYIKLAPEFKEVKENRRVEGMMRMFIVREKVRNI